MVLPFVGHLGSHEGSILFWTLLLALWGLAVAVCSRRLPQDVMARVIGVMGLISVGLTLFMLLTSDPFIRLFPLLTKAET